MRSELIAIPVAKLSHFLFVNTIAGNAARFFVISVHPDESRYPKLVKVLSQVSYTHSLFLIDSIKESYEYTLSIF